MKYIVIEVDDGIAVNAKICNDKQTAINEGVEFIRNSGWCGDIIEELIKEFEVNGIVIKNTDTEPCYSVSIIKS